MIANIRYKFHLSLFILALAGSLIVPICNTYIIMPKLERGIINNNEHHSKIGTEHIIKMLFIDKYLEGESSVSLSSLIKVSKELHIKKIRIYSDEGLILQSTSPNEIGNLNKHDYFKNYIAKGVSHSNLVRLSEMTAEGLQSTLNVVETYVPIMKNNIFLGALEVYHDVTKPVMALDEVILKINLSAISASMFLSFCLLILYLFTRRADREFLELLSTKNVLNLALSEKETLLAEIHHRVKNNMQVISSMLILQSDRIQSSEAKKALKDSVTRIKSMSLVHEKLYSNDTLSKIDINEYVVEVIRAYRRPNIKFHHYIEPSSMNIEQAIPLGLTINELLNNAIEHAFNNQSDAQIDIILIHSDSSYLLTISDNGKGLPEDIKIGDDKSFGLFLVSLFIKQLEGNLSVNREHGTRYEISFPR